MRHYHQRNPKRIAVIFFAIVFLLTLAAPTLADTVDGVINPSPEYSALEARVVSLNEKILEINESIKGNNSELDSLRTELTQKQQELEKLNSEATEQAQESEERIQAEYMTQSDDPIENLFSSDETTSQVENEEAAAEIIQADQVEADKLAGQVQTLKGQVDTLKQQISTKEQEGTKLQQDLKAATDEKAQCEAKLVAEREAGVKHADSAEKDAAIADGSKVIQEVAAQSEAKTKTETQAQAAQVSEQASQTAQEALDDLNSAKEAYQDSEDPEVNALLDQAQEVGETISAEQDKVDEAAKKTEEAATAADAVTQKDNIDTGLVVILDSNATAQEVVTQLKEVDLKKKQQEAQEAADKAKAKRDAQVEAGQQDAQKRAEEAEAEQQKQLEEIKKQTDEAARQAEEAKQKEEEAKKKQEEEQKRQEEQKQQEAQSGPFSSDYISQTGWRWPLDGIFEITSVFGYRVHPIFGDGRGHEGIDIAASTGTPVHACDGGEVILAGENGGYGNCIIVQQNSGHQVYYGHLSEIDVSVGQRISKGEVIGKVGSTGWSTGPHLHVGVLSGNGFVDPFIYFPEVDHMDSN